MNFPRIQPLRLLRLASSLFAVIQSAADRCASLSAPRPAVPVLRGCVVVSVSQPRPWGTGGHPPARSIDSTPPFCAVPDCGTHLTVLSLTVKPWLIRSVHGFAFVDLFDR